MTDFRPNPDPGAHLDADALADLLDAMQAAGRDARDPVDDPRVAVAQRLADAPHPVMPADARARVEAQLIAAVQSMPGTRLQRPPRRFSWPLAAAAALVLALAAVLVPEITQQTAAPASVTPTPTHTATATVTPTLTVTPSPTLTLTVTVPSTDDETREVDPAGDDSSMPVQNQEQEREQAADYDCTNPPPEGAQALGWRKHCEGAEPPNSQAPGQHGSPPGRSGESPGNSANAPGQIKR